MGVSAGLEEEFTGYKSVRGHGMKLRKRDQRLLVNKLPTRADRRAIFQTVRVEQKRGYGVELFSALSHLIWLKEQKMAVIWPKCKPKV